MDGKKTPYQLDLEVKDRKPSIVPKVGDRVKIKSREWYEKWKDEDDDVMFVHLPKFFSKGMSKYCGLTMTIKEELRHGFLFDNCEESWNWLPEFFEEVYPVQAQVGPTFPRITLDNPGQLSAHCTEMGKDILEKYPDVAAKIKEAGKRLAAYSVVKALSAKPKLKQIKTTRLMKITKL